MLIQRQNDPSDPVQCATDGQGHGPSLLRENGQQNVSVQDDDCDGGMVDEAKCHNMTLLLSTNGTCDNTTDLQAQISASPPHMFLLSVHHDVRWLCRY